MSLQIVDYKSEHQPFFEQFNRAWIEAFFVMEDVDRYVLQQPEDAILKPGGAILVALYNGQVAGTVALKKQNDKQFEFTKMAVDAPFRRKGIAEALSQAALERARELGAESVILYSQRGLAPAIALYRKLGFCEVPMESDVYQRSDIKMKISLKTWTTHEQHQH